MSTASQPPGVEPEHLTAERYFALVGEGVLSERDRVELLNGVVVAMAPSSPRHASVVYRVTEALQDVLRGRAAVRGQGPLLAGRHSVPEPDVAVVAGRHEDFENEHPRSALLVVEVSAWSLGQDRLTKAAIYAAAGIPEYWIVNLRDLVVEVRRDPDTAFPRYRAVESFGREELIQLVAFPDVRLDTNLLLPREPIAY